MLSSLKALICGKRTENIVKKETLHVQFPVLKRSQALEFCPHFLRKKLKIRFNKCLRIFSMNAEIKKKILK